MSQTPIRVGLIGAGSVSGAHLPAYQQFPEQVQLVAVADPVEELARQRAEQGGAERVYTDPYRMIQEAPIDAVDICAPHFLHAPLALAAIEAGKHVLVEKPMGITWEECRQMVEAADRAGVTLMAAQCLRYYPKYRAVRRAIQEGELGRIFSVEFASIQDLRRLRPPGNWMFDGKKNGGGTVIGLAVHSIDLVRYYLGNVRRVSALCKTMRPEYINGAEDYAVATMEFENDALGSLFSTNSCHATPWGHRFYILGESGAIHNTAIASRRRGSDGRFVELEPEREGLPTDDGFVNEILHWADCCRTGAEPISSGRDNLETMRVIFGIYESSRRGGAPVELASL
ncbi:MAG: dehydrogenase [Candidatus Poribacteria bacterium]|nr:MAG: dehydrogenase [Candidatus Poribacteria bacterium]